MIIPIINVIMMKIIIKKGSDALQGRTRPGLTITPEPVPIRQSTPIQMLKRNQKMKITILAAFMAACLATGPAVAAPTPDAAPLDAPALDAIRAQYARLMDLANRHDLTTLHDMFWQSPGVLLVAKSAVPSEGNWAGFWGNDAVDRKLHDIAASGPVELVSDFSRLKVVGLTHDVAESYAPMTITVSYAGQDGTPKPFLMIIDWIRVGADWKIASEIILPVPPSPAVKG
jgi:hypothetical protein